jgi:hypothetical protein
MPRICDELIATVVCRVMRFFITRRCFKKIRMRFKSRLFKKPMLKVLQEWKYDDGTNNLGELDGVYRIDPSPSQIF